MTAELPPLYFIRHGETDWNVQGRIQGSVETDLNATGIAQATAVARALAAHEPDLRHFEFAVSPQQRAQHTMRIICNLQPREFLTARSDERLRELGFGVWEGQPFDTLRANPAYPKDPSGHYHWRPEGGESYADGVARVDSFLRSLSGPTLVVSHGAVGRCLIGYACNIPRLGILHLPTPQGAYCVVRGRTYQWFDVNHQPL